MGRLRRSRVHKGIRDIQRKYRTKRYMRDLDQIHGDIQPENAAKFEKPELDPELPGLGQFYCIPCAKHHINKVSLEEHQKGKIHKKRVKLLKEEPYTQAEADAAAGLQRADTKSKKAKEAMMDISENSTATTTTTA
ncbi:bud site selection protein 20 [Entomortierella parvispora]|uniref:Bud site selection protein 20 n=1 Tax=Entomortierella parvispora TaxID=205924 RepID=A0A9P3LX84_9FUNG|nr:bud site selection protein 20 [Entomortierella parvispora]